MSNIDHTKKTKSNISLGLALPLFAFILLAGLFYYALKTGDPSNLPSVLIGKKVPQFALPAIEGQKAKIPGFSSEVLRNGKITIVNFWASWCGPCHQEHPFLVSLAKVSGAPMYGINYKDAPTNARRFLGRYENPYLAIGADRTGRVSIDWGVYGLPETFVVNGQGKIIYKHVGPIVTEAAKQKILDAIKKAKS